ncbi:MAG TPA: PEP-CTERM sorting domain-containing protein [Phenylobacterium sp.]|jgi:hypothetical protein|uniref:PEP-CTERM sorting domain-containing protein n=1 Tax=Phenylobacterium sp. TaxID=1871053 RepID=UPI002CF9F1D0|nr:PEP-CTERM sorting domain-containing protein [Phenylobacterium sp.]HXA38496.1 PEP-CTERM sorting domain-containing protein [Phenylobacterium sp.]
MKTLLLACAAMAVATGANATTLVFDFSLAPHQNDVGPTETYTVGGLSIYASGFNWSGAATDLYGKHGGGDENGLGLNNDPTGDHEIHYHSGFVQLDLSDFVGHVLAGSTTFGTNSVTGGEAWTVYGANTAGSLVGAVQLATGTNEAVNQVLPGLGAYRFFDFVETAPQGGENFLITKITTTATTVQQGVPEPASWALMSIGVGGLGALLRRRRARGAFAAA